MAGPADECVRYILSRSAGVGSCPIRRADLTHQIRRLCPLNAAHKRTDAAPLREAARILNQTYGYKLHEVGKKNNIQYILTLDKNSTPNDQVLFDEYKHDVLLASLAHIFMSGGSVKEEDLWQFLEKADLMKTNGVLQTKDILLEFRRNLYLKYVKEESSGFRVFNYEWGERAHLEQPKLILMKHIAEMFDQPSDYWYDQYKTAQEDDEKYFGLDEMDTSQQFSESQPSQSQSQSH